MKAVGFTGTLRGMTEAQRRTVHWLLRGARAGGATEFHHGGARGADTEAAAIAADLGFELVPHLPDRTKRNPELTRNREIVAAVDWLVAAPAQDYEVLRSGTWATVRYARAADVPVAFAFRDDPPGCP